MTGEITSDGLRGFADALTASGRHLPGGLVGPATRRFAVYRNNVAVGLIRSLETRFPAVLGLVGEEFFRAMAREFAFAHPPASPVMMDFGNGFPDFMDGFPPAAEFGYLADVARIEVARTRAYHAADWPRLGPEAFATIGGPTLDRIRLDLHPAVQIVASTVPAYTIFAMATGLRPAGPVEPWLPEDTLVDRPLHDVIVRPLPPGNASFFSHLRAGNPLGAAAAQAGEADHRFDLSAALAELIGSGMIARIHQSEGMPS